MAAIITLTTDFGARDAYVGAMKGVILSILPSATIVDITHDIPPQDIRHGAFVLAAAAAAFPPGTVHVAVVDPGVGTRRRAIAVEGGGQTFVGPDNGLLSMALRDAGASNAARCAPTGRQAFVGPNDGLLSMALRDAGATRGRRGVSSLAPLPAAARGVELTDPSFHQPRVSATFHGRDIFAPVAAHLASGVALPALGAAIDHMRALALPGVRRTASGGVTGVVVHIDGYGNLVTNIAAEDLPKATLHVTVAGKTMHGLSRNFAQGGPLLTLVGSYGLLEIAVRNGSAAQELGARRGMRVTVRLG